jgi:uncharacterized membrane protein (UPF0136 family)
MTAWIILIYGLLVLAGGIMGYVKAQSTPSLVAGGLSGVILIASALAMMRGAYQIGWWIALVVAVLLLGRFGVNAATHGFKMMPGGLMIILSLIAIVALVAGKTR